MNKTTRTCLISLGSNALLAALLSIPLFFISGGGQYDGLAWLVISLLIFVVALVIQLFVGFSLAIGEKNKEVGKGMLISVGIILLIGFSVCTPMLI